MSFLFIWCSFFAFLGLFQFGTCATCIIYGNSRSNKTEVPLSECEKILQSPQYDSNKCTYVFISGFNNSQNGEAVITLTTLSIDVLFLNTVLINWEQEAAALPPTNTSFEPLLVTPISYVRAVAAAFAVGTDMGLAFARMRNLGLNISCTYFICFSLGCPLLGQAARTYKTVTGELLEKTTCLEHAGPGFNHPVIFPPMTKEDATYVECWHTDTWFGTNATVCHIDIRFNYLVFTLMNKSLHLQPGCTDELCNHNRSWRYFDAAVRACGIMVAALADSVYDWIRQGTCSALVTMCLNIRPAGALGVYYLNTTDTPPYGLGLAGACTP